MESIKETDLNLQREKVTSVANTWLVKAVNPTTGEEKMIDVSNFSSVVAGQIGLVAKSKAGLMPSLTKHLYHRCESSAGVLLARINLTYAGLAMLYTTVGSRGYSVGLYALTANLSTNATTQVKVKCLIPGKTTQNTTVKYTKVGNEVSIYLVRDAYTLCVGAEVIYNDESVKNFLENVEEIPSDAVDATVIE